MKRMVPLVFFAFNRPDKAERVLAAVREQTVRPGKILVFSDGPRNAGDEPKVEAVRRLIRAIDWAEVVVRERERNFGCAPNILQGLAEVFAAEKAAVILEDDTLPARCWCEAMNRLLEHYEDQPQVFSVGGYPVIKREALPDYPYDVILSPRASIWGWGTWASRWDAIRGELLDFKSPYRRPLDVPTLAGFDVPFTVEAIAKRPDFYWDSKIAILCLYHGWLNALTKNYLVSNIGMESGDHGSPDKDASYLIENTRVEEKLPARFPPATLLREVHEAVEEYLADGYRAGYHCEPPNPHPSWPRRIVDGIARRWRRAAGGGNA